MADAPFDVAQAHRWFGIEFNNQGWDLLEHPDPTMAHKEAMIHTAHASLVHWRAGGEPINELRALCLLTSVYAGADRENEAIRYGEDCIELCQELGDEPTAFDRATAYGAMANACQCAEQHDEAAKFYAQALGYAATLKSADDRAVFDKFFPNPAGA